MFKEFNLENLENSKELLENLLDENRKKIDDLLKLENKCCEEIRENIWLENMKKKLQLRSLLKI